MKRVVLVLLSLYAISCGNAGSERLSWSADTVYRTCEGSVVDLQYPVADGGVVADSLNKAIVDLVEFGLYYENDYPENQTVAAVVDTLLAQKNRDTVIRRMPYEISSSGLVYERDNIVSIYITKYMYMGGAHGITDSRYMNFNRRTGSQLSANQLFNDTTALSVINTAAFKSYLDKKDIENVESLLFVNVDKLPLPKNIGLDSVGVVMLYNQYEIAPYSFGQSCYTIPYSEVDKLINNKNI